MRKEKKNWTPKLNVLMSLQRFAQREKDWKWRTVSLEHTVESFNPFSLPGIDSFSSWRVTGVYKHPGEKKKGIHARKIRVRQKKVTERMRRENEKREWLQWCSTNSIIKTIKCIGSGIKRWIKWCSWQKGMNTVWDATIGTKSISLIPCIRSKGQKGCESSRRKKGKSEKIHKDGK